MLKGLDYLNATHLALVFINKSLICCYNNDGLQALGFPGSSPGKESACNAGDPGSIPGSGRSPRERDRFSIPVFLPGESHRQRSLAGYIL